MYSTKTLHLLSWRFIDARHSAILNGILLEWAEQTKKIYYTQHSLQSLLPGKTAALLPFKLATTEVWQRPLLLQFGSGLCFCGGISSQYSHGYAGKLRRCRHLDQHTVANSGCESFSQKHSVRFSNLFIYSNFMSCMTFRIVSMQ